MKTLKNLPFVFALLFGILLSNSGCMIALMATAKDGAKKGRNDKKDNLRASEKTFSSADLEKLKSSTTLFVLKDNDEDQLESFQKSISRVWDFNEIKVIPFKEWVDYTDKDGYSFFMINGVKTDVETTIGVSVRPGLSYSNTHYYLTLTMPMEVKTKKGKAETQNVGFCRIELFPDTETMSIENWEDTDEVLLKLYTEGHFKNMTPAMVSLYLEQTQKDLVASKRPWLFEETEDKSELKKLANKTLLVPDYVLEEYNKFTGEESAREDEMELFKKYPYRYKILSAEELNHEIETANKTLYVFDYIKSSTDKFVCVYNTRKGLIYKSYKAGSYNLKASDLKAIVN